MGHKGIRLYVANMDSGQTILLAKTKTTNIILGSNKFYLTNSFSQLWQCFKDFKQIPSLNHLLSEKNAFSHRYTGSGKKLREFVPPPLPWTN